MKISFRALWGMCWLVPGLALGQSAKKDNKFTRADSLRGSITGERIWWDVQQYDISVQPDFLQKFTCGNNLITYKVLEDTKGRNMQIDLQEPLIIDSILFNKRQSLSFTKDGHVWHVQAPVQKKGASNTVQVFFHGHPHEAKRAPWDGGWTFTTDSLNRPWMTVTCQGLGASIWYPCKDHQSDEPDLGASLTMTVPDSLTAVANGRLQFKKNNGNGTTSYKWAVQNPINNYNIIPYIGKYVHFNDAYNGEKGKLDLDYWVLDYNLNKAKQYFPKEVHNMLKAFEHWFGPYPFYEDGFKLIDVSHTGMEHQSAVAYGNQYKPGYRMRDGSGTGWGLKWDFIIVHEAGHEWFGNNITTKDLADMWVHEGFTNYSETLYVDYQFGTDAGNAYNAGIRKGIRNEQPIIPPYGVNAQGSGDMYPKGGNLLHAIRHSMDDDAKFRNILKGLNKTFYHKTVTSKQVEDYVSKQAGFDYSKVFDQYLRTIDVPVFEYYFSPKKDTVFFRYRNTVDGFNLPLVLKNNALRVKLLPTTSWKSMPLKENQVSLFEKEEIEKMYYLEVVLSEEKN